MAALPPRYARRRSRRGSLERPVSGRLYRGTWLLVGVPLLIAAFSVHKAESLPAPQDALPPSFDRVAALEVATELARVYPDRMPGTAGALGAAAFVRQQLAPVRAEGRARPVPRGAPGTRRENAREPGRDRPGTLSRRDRRHGPPGRQRRRTGRQRQCLGHRNPDPARALVRLTRRSAAGQSAAYPRLRRHRRRSVRGSWREAVRRAAPGAGGRGDRPDRARGTRATAVGARRHRAAARLAGAGRDRVATGARAGGPKAGAPGRPGPADRSRLPVHPLRARADAGPRPADGDLDERGRAAAGVLPRPAVSAQRRAPRATRPRRRAAPALARLGRRARSRAPRPTSTSAPASSRAGRSSSS